MSEPVAPIAPVGGQPVAIESVVEAHRNLVDPSRPVALRLRVAKGLLPSTMGDLVPTLAYLRHDADREVREAVRGTLSGMPADELVSVVSELTDASVLDTLARALPSDVEATMRVATNRATGDASLLYLAGVGGSQLCTTIGRNEVRCLAQPALIEALFFNPKAPQGVVQNLMELAVRQDLALDHMPGYIETRSALLGERRFEQDDAPGLDEIEFLTAVELAFDDAVKGDGDGDGEYQTRNLATMIGRMSVSQKIRLALVGDAGARKLLVRDPKKNVALAVLKSPRLTESEVKSFASNKSLAEEVIGQIARRRSWTREYSIRLALILNPKTPLPFAMGFLRTMNKRDMKMISKNRDVSQVVARQAQRVLTVEERAKKRKRR